MTGRGSRGEDDAEGVDGKKIANTHIDVGEDGCEEEERNGEGEEDEFTSSSVDTGKGQEEKKEHEGEGGFEQEDGREEEPFAGAVKMTKDKAWTGALAEKDVDPAVKIGLGKKMMAGEELDHAALERVGEHCGVDGERWGDLELAGAGGVAEAIESPEDDVAEDGDGEKS